MTGKETSVPALSVARTIRDNIGCIAFTFSRNSLGDLLDHLNARDVEEIPEQSLRLLCYLVSSQNMHMLVEKAEEHSPGSANIVAEITQGKHSATISSDDVGHDLFKRIVPAEDEDFVARLNPLYNVVRLEIGVYDDDQSTALPGQRLSQTLLSTLLQPPNLA